MNKHTIILAVLFLGIWSCQETDEIPLKESNLEFFQLIEEGLSYTAKDLRSNGLYFNNLESTLQSMDRFLKERIGQEENDLFAVQSTSNSELSPEIYNFIEKTESDIEDLVLSAKSYSHMEELLYKYVENNADGLNSQELSVLVLTTHLELIFTQFLVENVDLINSPDNDGASISNLLNEKSGIDGWSWSEIKKLAKCAVGVVSGTVTGTITACVGVGGFVFQISGGVATLPVSGQAAITGCAIGGALGGLAGAGISAVNSGCFEL